MFALLMLLALLLTTLPMGLIAHATEAETAPPTEAETVPAAEEATSAAEEAVPNQEPVEIHTVEDLQAMAENPTGTYILMEDLDMTGISWKGPDFSGTFDGNGHAILNLTLSEPGAESVDTYDGNLKVYESAFVGFFSTLRNAEVKNLKLVNVRAAVDTDKSCFVGGIAGYMEKSTISGCAVTGILDLRAYEKMFGVGGVAGYGSGVVENCYVDVTLISTDTKSTKDEMFLGGVCGMGFLDIKNCTVLIAGFASEYGYAHTGGLMGMMMRYPLGDWTSTVTGNNVTGKITFFECIADRRAYCEAFIGEQMTNYCNMTENTENFVRDERMVYDVELRPETCEEPVYKEIVVEGVCNAYGYTIYKCEGCGYTYTDHYTFYGDHEVTTWTLSKEPTVEEEGLSVGLCDHCGEEFQRTEEKLDPPPTEAPTEPPETTEPPTEPPVTETTPVEPEPEEKGGNGWLIVVLVIAVLIAVVLIVFKPFRKGRFQRGK